MNRQAGPSIVLSVLIVGFFAVALYPRDPPGSTRGRSGAVARHPGIASEASRRASPTDVASRSVRSAKGVPSATSAGVPPTVGAGPPPTAPVKVVASPSGRPASEPGLVMRGTPSPTIDRRPNVRAPGSAAPIIRTVSKPSAGPDPAPTTAARPSRSGVPRQPQSAFTVVKAEETFTDVALRVYGTAEEADVLWRANRDTMPRQDSPLLPGTLLRTPMVR